MTQSLAASMFEDVGFQSRFSKCTLQDRFVQMMPALLAGKAIYKMIRCRKNPLPAPLPTGVWIFALEVHLGERLAPDRAEDKNRGGASSFVGIRSMINDSFTAAGSIVCR